MDVAPGTVPATAVPASQPSNFWLAFYVAVLVGKFSEWVPGLGSIPLAKIAIAFTAISAWRTREARVPVSVWSLRSARPAVAFLTLAIFSIVFSIYRGGSLGQMYGVVVLLFSVILLIKTTQSQRDIERLLVALCIAGAGLTIGVLVTYSGGRARINLNFDSNDLAYGMVTILPIMRAIAATIPRLKLVLNGISVAVAAAVLLTGSRGGVIGLAVVVFLLVAFPISYNAAGKLTEFRLARVVVVLSLIAIVGVAGWNYLPEESRARAESLFDLKDDYNLGSSNASRTAVWLRNSAAVITRPIGFGLGSSEAVDGMTGGAFRAMHNSFVESLVELGVLGLWLYCAAYFVTLKQLGRVSALARGRLPPENSQKLCLYARALRISLTGNMVAGFFLSQAYAGLLWTLIAVCAALVRVSPLPPPSPTRAAGR